MCTRNIDRRHCAAGSAHEAMKQTTAISVVSRDNPRRINGRGDGALVSACTCTWRLERSVRGAGTSPGSRYFRLLRGRHYGEKKAETRNGYPVETSSTRSDLESQTFRRLQLISSSSA